ncbi:hypothetical protein Tco_1159384 [Tanacetum coccineum]
MECVTTTSFSISINGSLHGHFKGRRGLRQGDLISPYLFTIVMEVLTLMLKRRVREVDGFTFHWYCSEMELINLCFVDDLFLFAHGDVQSAKRIMESLDKFKLVYGLTPSLPKSTAYFCNVLNHIKLTILQVMPFEEGRLLVKYLGVPLVPSRLVYKDCKELIEKVEARVNDWKNKSLSIAGRLQLVQSVIASIHVYWASVFILPTRILLDIEQIMRGFLWCQGSMRKGKAKVVWDVVCLPKDEDGLRIRRLDLFNKALMAVYIWKLLSMKESLWVAWIKLHKIKDRNFWDIPCRGNMSWGWRKVLQLRPCIRKFVWHKIGDRARTSLWLNTTSKVADVLGSGSLVWPQELGVKYPLLLSIPSPRLSLGVHDKLEWRLRSGSTKPFAVSTVWQFIRPRDVKVTWVDVVWFPNCIPRHAFNLWLVIKRKLKTQDNLRSWDVSSSLAISYPLCESQPDSHEHLFFACSFSTQVWLHLRDLAGLSHIPPNLEVIMDYIIPMAKRRTSTSVISKLVLAALAYFIWQERNNRLFMCNKRPAAKVIECIILAIRLKLMLCHFKKSKAGLDLMKPWKLSEMLLI